MSEKIFLVGDLVQNPLDNVIWQIMEEDDPDIYKIYSASYNMTVLHWKNYAESYFRFYKRLVPFDPRNTYQQSSYCEHEWKEYVGLVHTDQYCVKCGSIEK